MGEGKTSVIIPMIVLAHLEIGIVPRIVVLDSMQVECRQLYSKLFGMMGLRLNTFTCNRVCNLNNIFRIHAELEPDYATSIYSFPFVIECG